MTTEAENKLRPFFEPGYYPDMPNEDYHGSFGYGSTTLKILAEKTKLHMDYERENPKPMTDALIKGQLLHTMVLEPHLVEKEFAVRPDDLEKPSSRIINAKKPSAESLHKIAAWNNWLEKLNGRIEVTPEQESSCKAMADSIHNHPIMGNWFNESINGLAEQSIFYWYKSEDWDEKNDYKIMLKVRPDWILEGHPVIFDIKSTRDASFSEFMKTCKTLGYHMSAAMYLDGCNRNKEFLERCGVVAFTKFVWVVVENTPPYLSTFYEISEEDLYEGRQMYHRLVRKLDLYNRSEWNGYGEQNESGIITPDGRLSELPKYGNPIV